MEEALIKEKSMDEADAREQIAFIKQVIEDSRNLLVENGLLYIIYGCLIILGTVATYIAIIYKVYTSIFWIWGIVNGIIIIINLVFRLKLKKKKIKSFAGRVYGSLWGGFLLFIIFFFIPAIISGKINQTIFLATISGALGLVYYVSHILLKNRLMILLAFGWWAGVITFFFLPSSTGYILMAAMVFLFEVVPGTLFYISWRKKAATHEGI